MKASNYWSEWADDPVLDKLAEYTESYPIEDETLADLDWVTEDDEILFYQDLEELAETDFSDEALEAAFSGEMKVAHLLELLGMMEKNAKITTQGERIKMRMYRMQNKAQLARKARIRRMRTRSGMHRKKKRIGTAAGGYTFITDTGAGVGGSRSNAAQPKAATHAPKASGEFNPESNTGSTERRSKLKAHGL